MNLDLLEKLEDGELRAVIGKADELLKRHDTERKDKALSEARATLAAVGLTLKDLGRKSPVKSKGPIYHSGRTYQHPGNKALTWTGKGKKPAWLTALEADGGKAIELSSRSTIAP